VRYLRDDTLTAGYRRIVCVERIAFSIKSVMSRPLTSLIAGILPHISFTSIYILTELSPAVTFIFNSS
jgi:hypothetical protein